MSSTDAPSGHERSWVDFDRVTSAEFWRELEPDLSIERKSVAPSFDVGDVGALIDRLKTDGYINVPGVVPLSLCTRLRACLGRLHERQIPIVFAFVYDEMWEAFQGVGPYLSGVLGEDYKALPDFWAWFIPNADGSAGWGPHRDRLSATVLSEDNMPFSLTVWLPFSDATPLNGCIYVLPAHLDGHVAKREYPAGTHASAPNLQDVRALPAPAGSLLSWHQNVLHWGGRASRLAPAPRCSAGFEFQSGSKPPFHLPLLDPHSPPTFLERLGLIGKQVIQYRTMYPLTREVHDLASRLHYRFLAD